MLFTNTRVVFHTTMMMLQYNVMKKSDGGSNTPPADHEPLPVPGCTPDHFHPDNNKHINSSIQTQASLQNYS